MIQLEHLEHILFVDIETVSAYSDWPDVPTRTQQLWQKKSDSLQRMASEPTPATEFYAERAAIFAEFGRIVCVSAGYIKRIGSQYHLRIKSFCNDEEGLILESFSGVVDSFMSRPIRKLCAHNGKEFDFPYLGRRYLANRLPVPKSLQTQGKRPWEVPYLDTMDLWRFGDYRTFVSLDLLADTLGLPSPKDDITGADVGRVFWQDHDLARIQSYCERDVVTTAQVMLAFCGESATDLVVEHAGED